MSKSKNSMFIAEVLWPKSFDIKGILILISTQWAIEELSLIHIGSMLAAQILQVNITQGRCNHIK